LPIDEKTSPILRAHADDAAVLPLSLRLLTAIAIGHARSARFDVVAEPRPGERTSARVRLGATHDIWLIRWGAGSQTVLHDHGGSAGVHYVAAGRLAEYRPDPAVVGSRLRRELRECDHRTMSRAHLHEVSNESAAGAASIHVYSPPLETMGQYEVSDGSRPRMMRREIVDVDIFATG
jgi:predicted metal-dependent enzyme (double-stranded beta helix superfamily)